ncbi:MAG: hypothetical protein SPK72_04590 [Bacteroidales bacterium]|nr:hypothetical protein [Bacteroidales bacterium]
MKNLLIYIFSLVLVLTACHKTKADVDSNSVAPTPDEPVVKKYLVKEYYYGYPNEPIKVIEWNEDYSKINHISTYQNTYYQLDFDFEYYGNDSMQVTLSAPDTAWSMVIFTSYICHFDNSKKISKIDYYVNSVYQNSEQYNYDLNGKLVSIIDEEHDCGGRFVWDGDNVVGEYSLYSVEPAFTYEGFIDKYHQYSTLPYLLRSGDCYHGDYLTKPLWKNVCTYNSQQIYYEYDKDGYITLGCHVTLEGDTIPERCYEYLK